MLVDMRSTSPAPARPPALPAPSGVRLREWRDHFLTVLRPYWTPLVLAHLAMLLDAMLTVLRPWPLKLVIDRVIEQRHSRVPLLGHWLESLALDRMQVIYAACGASLLIALGTGLSTFYYTRAMGWVGEHFTFDLRRKLFAHMQRLSLRFHDRQRTGDLTTRLSADINAIDDLITDSSPIVIFNGALLIGMIAMMLWLNWRFALVALSVAPLLFATVLRFRWRIRGAARVGAHKTSMLQDLEAGRPLEIDALVGSVVELAQHQAIDVPHLQTLYACVKLLEAQRINGPG